VAKIGQMAIEQLSFPPRFQPIRQIVSAERRFKMRRSPPACVALLILGFAIFLARGVRPLRALGDDLHYRLPISSMTFSPDGKLLATTAGWTVVVSRVSDGEQLREIRLKPSEGYVVGLTFSPDGKLLFGGCADGRLLQWLVDTGEQTNRVMARPEASSKYLVFAVAFSHDKTLFANGNSSGEVNVWDIATGRHIANLSGSHGQIRSLAFSPDDSLLATGDSGDLILVWDLKKHGDPRVLRRTTDRGTPGWIYSIVFMPDAKTLASSGFYPGVVFWSLSTSKQSFVIGSHYDWVQSIDISPDGAYLLTGSRNGDDRDPTTHVPRSHRVSLWSLKSGTAVREFPGAASAFSPNGQQLAIAQNQKIIFRPTR
jgi:WD40 repeat protein